MMKRKINGSSNRKRAVKLEKWKCTFVYTHTVYKYMYTTDTKLNYSLVKNYFLTVPIAQTCTHYI